MLTRVESSRQVLSLASPASSINRRWNIMSKQNGIEAHYGKEITTSYKALFFLSALPAELPGSISLS